MVGYSSNGKDFASCPLIREVVRHSGRFGHVLPLELENVLHSAGWCQKDTTNANLLPKLTLINQSVFSQFPHQFSLLLFLIKLFIKRSCHHSFHGNGLPIGVLDFEVGSRIGFCGTSWSSIEFHFGRGSRFPNVAFYIALFLRTKFLGTNYLSEASVSLRTVSSNVSGVTFLTILF